MDYESKDRKRRSFRCAVDGYGYDDHDPIDVHWTEGPRDAACAFAERECQRDSDWYSTFERGEPVSVRDCDTGAETRWIVEMEAVPHFRAISDRRGSDD